MSTRSRIGYLTNRNTVYSVYCGHDGYLEYVGRILAENYTDPYDVVTLINMGGIDSLGKNLKPRGMDNPYGTKFYGEEDSVQLDFGMRDFERYCFDCDEEFVYLFKDGKWVYATRDDYDEELARLSWHDLVEDLDPFVALSDEYAQRALQEYRDIEAIVYNHRDDDLKELCEYLGGHNFDGDLFDLDFHHLIVTIWKNDDGYNAVSDSLEIYFDDLVWEMTVDDLIGQVFEKVGRTLKEHDAVRLVKGDK